MGLPFTSVPSPPPPLSSVLLDKYKVLDVVQKGLFRGAYRELWDCVAPISMFIDGANVLAYYFLIDKLLHKQGLIASDLSVLARLWLYSNGGRCAVISKGNRFSRNELHRIKQFVTLGYLSRSHFNPLQPYSPRNRRPNYISFTPKGVQYYKGVLLSFRGLILAHHLNDVPHGNRKGQP